MDDVMFDSLMFNCYAVIMGCAVVSLLTVTIQTIAEIVNDNHEQSNSDDRT